MARFGVGNAIAQPYNHTILPLASTAEKITQIAWGIADFEYRFGRKPVGMWLPETAVDLETLNILADRGIEFTLLAPWQAKTDLLDPTEPYQVRLPGRRSITVFFYQRDLSSKISFDPNATSNADLFASSEILRYYRAEKLRKNEPQLLLIASDGELYGHHQPFRERFLSHLLNGAGAKGEEEQETGHQPRMLADGRDLASPDEPASDDHPQGQAEDLEAKGLDDGVSDVGDAADGHDPDDGHDGEEDEEHAQGLGPEEPGGAGGDGRGPAPSAADGAPLGARGSAAAPARARCRAGFRSGLRHI